MKRLMFSAVALVLAGVAAWAQPTTVPAPLATGNDAIGIYSSALGNTDGYFFADWSCGNVGSEIAVGDAKVFKIPNFTYYGSQFTALDVTKMKYLVVDVFPETDMTLAIVPITGTVEKGVQSAVTGGKWNTIKIPVETFTKKGCNMANMYQIKYTSTVIDNGDGNVDGFGNGDGTKTFYVGNVYCYKEAVSYEDTEAPVITSATVASVSYASATLSLTATDNKSESIYYTVTDQNGTAYKVTGKSGEATSLNITGLNAGTQYTLTVKAADEKGNVSEAKTLEVTTQSLPDIPQPVANELKSVFSPYTGNTDGYFFNSWGGGTGAAININGKVGYMISKFAYFGSEFTAIDVTSWKKLHIDVLPLQDMTLTIIPITGTIEKGVQFSLKANEWNTLEVPVATYVQKGCNMANLYQIKYMGTLAADGGDGNVDGFGTGDGTQSFIVGNVYFYNEVSTGVNGVNVAQPVVDGPAFNVAGQQVSSDYKGIVVKNGKKYINR